MEGFAWQVVSEDNLEFSELVDLPIDVLGDIVLEENQEIIVRDISIGFSLPELFALYCLALGSTVLCFAYVRAINRSQRILPNLLHRLFCPVWSVLRWEGFDSDKPLYALVFGCFYSVFFWTPSETEEEEEDDIEVFNCGYADNYELNEDHSELRASLLV